MAATITIKNIPDNLYEKLKVRAAANHRSINREIFAIFEEAFGMKSFDPKVFLFTARSLREKSRDAWLTQDFFDGDKNEGRQ